MAVKGLTTPFIALVASSLFVCVGAWDFWGASYWIDTLVLKTEGNTYATMLHHPFLFKGKPTHAQEVVRRISGAVAGESMHKSRHSKYPSQTLIPRITLFSICLSFSSPPLHPFRFIRPSSVCLFVCFDVLLGSFARLVGIVVYLLLNREPKIYGSSFAC